MLKLKLFSFLFCLLFSFAAEGAVIPIDIMGDAPKINLSELVQECPNFSSYPGYNGVIWQKNLSYQLDGGSTSVTSVVVLLGKPNIDKKWFEWEIKIPNGGKAEVFQSALYDPGSLSEIQTVVPQKNLESLKITFSPPKDEFIVVLTYKQTFVGKLLLSDLVWLSDELPIWEQSITARVDSGEKFAHRSNTDAEPKESTDGKFDFYTWLFVNQTPDTARSLRVDTRPWLAFGNGKQGYDGLIPSNDSSSGKSSANRLSITFNLDLSEDWTMTGSADIVIRGEWKNFIPLAPKEIVKDIFGTEKIFAGKFETKESKGTLEIGAPLKSFKVIIGTLGANVIVPLPAIQPSWLADLGKAILPYSIRFPMTIEANYRINLPARTKDVFLPSNVDIGMDSLKYSEKYSRRNRRVELAMRFSVGGNKLGLDLARDMKAATARWGMQKNIPIRVK